MNSNETVCWITIFIDQHTEGLKRIHHKREKIPEQKAPDKRTNM